MAEKIRFATWENSPGGEHESYRREYKSLYLILSEKHLLGIPVCVGVGHVIGGHQGHEEQMAICLKINKIKFHTHWVGNPQIGEQ